MNAVESAARDFLAQKRIAIVGVSRHGDVAANAIYRRLRTLGYDVVAVNPNAEAVEGDACYPDLMSIPDGVDAAVIATHPDVSAAAVRDCARAGIDRVWLHRGLGTGSVSEEAIQTGKELGLRLIPGSCPMMFCEPVDGAHRCLRWFLRKAGRETSISRNMEEPV